MRYTLFILFIIAISSCKQNTEAEVKTAPSQTDVKSTEPTGDLNLTKDSSEVTFTSEEAGGIHEAYLELKAAFVNTDASDAAEIAADFKQMLGTVAEDGSITRLKAGLEEISKSKDVNDQRSAFETVSAQVENYLSNKISSGTIYKQYCPMAFDGEGAYWLSDSKEIRNPYFGDKMLKCGVVDKELQ